MSNWQDSCYLLHKRPFKDHYSWVFLLSKEHGVVSACVREAKKQKTGIEPLLTFARYWCSGRAGQILRLNKIELEAPAGALAGMAAISGLYINELIYSTCREFEAKQVFEVYTNLLPQLAQGGQTMLIALREFELFLLTELGYAIDFSELTNFEHYHYHAQTGLTGTAAATNLSFKREHLQAIANLDWQQPGALQAARKLLKLVLATVLDGKQLQTYAWFQEPA